MVKDEKQSYPPHNMETTISRLAEIMTDVIAKRNNAEIAWDYKPSAAKWSKKEIIGHLIEENARDFAGRIQMMLDQSKPQLQISDEDAVACLREGCKKEFPDLWDEFVTIRTQSAAFLYSLPPEGLDRVGIHPKLGTIRVFELLNEWVYHDLNHLNQINRNLQTALWPQLGAMQGFYG